MNHQAVFIGFQNWVYSGMAKKINADWCHEADEWDIDITFFDWFNDGSVYNEYASWDHQPAHEAGRLEPGVYVKLGIPGEDSDEDFENSIEDSDEDYEEFSESISKNSREHLRKASENIDLTFSKKRSIKCGKCGNTGHNARTCGKKRKRSEDETVDGDQPEEKIVKENIWENLPDIIPNLEQQMKEIG